MRAISDLSTLVFLNILTVIFCIPIVTAGASLAAMHYVIMEMIEDRGGGLLQEFWKRFRENLRNATPVWLILLAAAAFLYADQRIIAGGQLGLPRAMLIPIYVGAFVVAAGFVYSTGAVFRNAVILAAAYLPRTILMAAITVATPYLFANVSSLMPLFFLLGFSMPAYLCALLYTPVFEKMIGKREDEDRPWILPEDDTKGNEE